VVDLPGQCWQPEALMDLPGQSRIGRFPAHGPQRQALPFPGACRIPARPAGPWPARRCFGPQQDAAIQFVCVLFVMDLPGPKRQFVTFMDLPGPYWQVGSGDPSPAGPRPWPIEPTAANAPKLSATLPRKPTIPNK
jgi:hypothetical protein